MTPLFGIKGNHWGERLHTVLPISRLLRSCNGLRGNLQSKNKTFGNKSFVFFISGKQLESKEHKTVIINWL